MESRLFSSSIERTSFFAREASTRATRLREQRHPALSGCSADPYPVLTKQAVEEVLRGDARVQHLPVLERAHEELRAFPYIVLLFFALCFIAALDRYALDDDAS